jgi:Tfp pilus assembly protein PilO
VSRNYRILLVAVAAVLAVGGFWKLALAPKRAQAADLAKQVNDAKAQLAQSQGLLHTYSGAQRSYKADYATVVRLGQAIPSDDDTRSLVVQLDAAAKRSGTSFDTIDVTSAGGGRSGAPGATASADTGLAPGAVNAGSYSEMPLSLSFSGDFATLENFLGRVQRFVTVKGDKILVNGRLMRLESISLQPGDAGWPSLNVQLTASSYIVPDDATASPSATPSSTTTTTTTTTSPGPASGAASDKPGSPE